jgi:hypothetical protein
MGIGKLAPQWRRNALKIALGQDGLRSDAVRMSIEPKSDSMRLRIRSSSENLVTSPVRVSVRPPAPSMSFAVAAIAAVSLPLHDDFRALAREQLHDRGADAARAPRHKCHFVLQCTHNRLPFKPRAPGVTRVDVTPSRSSTAAPETAPQEGGTQQAAR